MAIPDKTIHQSSIGKMIPCTTIFKVSISNKKNMQNVSPGFFGKKSNCLQQYKIDMLYKIYSTQQTYIDYKR